MFARKMKITLLLLIVLGVYVNVAQSLNENLLTKLDNAGIVTKKSIDFIYSKWQIDKFPYFLKSCYMHKTAWEMLKLRFQKKILAAMSTSKAQRFVISFTGRY